MSNKKEKCNNSSIIQIFHYEGLSVRTLNIDGEIWFIAKDIADILGYSDATHATRYLNDDEKALFNTHSNNMSEISTQSDCVSNSKELPKREMLKNTNTKPTLYSGIEVIISEPGLYELVFRSNKPDTKAFSRWVRYDVLLSIRKSGQFSLTSPNRQRDNVKYLRNKQKNTSERLAFWNSLLKASHDIFGFLLATSRDWPRVYVVPDAIRNNENDHNDVHLLRCWTSNVNEFLNSKILFLERKSENIKKIFRGLIQLNLSWTVGLPAA